MTEKLREGVKETKSVYQTINRSSIDILVLWSFVENLRTDEREWETGGRRLRGVVAE